MKSVPVSLLTLAALLVSTSPALAAVTSDTVTDAAGDQKKGSEKAASKSAYPLSSVDISQTTLSYDSSTNKVFYKLRVKDVAPVKTKDGFTTEQSFSFTTGSANSYFVLGTDAPNQASFVSDEAMGAKQRKKCNRVTGSANFKENTVTFIVPAGCWKGTKITASKGDAVLFVHKSGGYIQEAASDQVGAATVSK